MSYSDDNSFEKILDRCLANDRLINVDKRVGSIIYDALAPVCLELAEAYAKMDILESQTFLMTATGTNLDKRVYDYGLTRNQATYAQRIASFKKYKTDSNGNYVLDEDGNKILVDMKIPEGMRFAVPNDSTTFMYIGKISGYEIVQCEQTGTKGNSHIGQILPLTPLANLVSAEITSTYKPAEDEETDDSLRQRAVVQLNYLPFGGNIFDYINKVNAIDGVGMTKVFPAWQYNGSVLLSIVDPQFDPVTAEFAENVKEQVDPSERSGEGVGIAPIGHYVTVTTPTKFTIDVDVTLKITVGTEFDYIQEEVERLLEEYFSEQRQTFYQDTDISIYRARIIDRIISIPSVLNVTDVHLNGVDEDITLYDEGLIGKQYLPYLGSVTIE